MAHEMKTSLGDRNVIVQNGAGDSPVVWLEVERFGNAGITTIALTHEEADTLARSLTQAAGRAALNVELGATLVASN